MSEIKNEDSLVGINPKDILLQHGPTKLLLDNYHWHSPNIGIISSYTVTEKDVQDHFGVFRGVDQIESFGQATVCANMFLEYKKHKCTRAELSEKFSSLFIGIGRVNFHSYLEKGDTFINIVKIKFYKFRQMITDGRIYKVPKGIDLDKYFNEYTEKQLLDYNLGNDFTLISEFFDITGREIKKELLKSI